MDQAAGQEMDHASSQEMDQEMNLYLKDIDLESVPCGTPHHAISNGGGGRLHFIRCLYSKKTIYLVFWV